MKLGFEGGLLPHGRYANVLLQKMSSNELKRGRASRSPSPKSSGQENKRPRVDDEEEEDLAASAADGMPLLLGQASPVPVAVAGQAPSPGPTQAQARRPSPEASPEVLVIVGEVIDLTGDTDEEDEEAAPPPAPGPTIIDLTGDTDDEDEVPPPSPPHPNPDPAANPHASPEPGPEQPRARSPRSPTPWAHDQIRLWMDERRPFPGTCILQTPHEAKETAVRACSSALWVNGVPQIIVFCDGSNKSVPNRDTVGTTGGYGVVVRNPWAGMDNPDAPGPAVPFGFERRQGFGVKSWSYTKIYSSAQAEAGALAQSVFLVLQLMLHYRPESAVIQIFTDSQECWHRIKHGLNHRPWRRSVRHISPIMRAIVWMTYRIRELGGDVKIRWNPRRCASGPRLADDAAGRHFKIREREALEFNQRNLQMHERDRILLMLNEEIGAVVRQDEMPDVELPDWFGP